MERHPKAARLAVKRTNEPYEPIYFPETAEPWRRYLERFLRYCEAATIDSKETGATRLILLSSQRYLVEAIFWGLSEGYHKFVIVKARQLGASSVLWLLDLWWLTTFPGLLGWYVADEEETKEDHRVDISTIYSGIVATAPELSRGPWTKNNRQMMLWASTPTWRRSRLKWAYVNHRKGGKLGVGRGINYVHGTEIDTWGDEEGVAAFAAALADHHPRRLYLFEGTGRGYGQLFKMWEQAESSTTMRRIFVAFWRRDDYVVTRDERAKWDAYGRPPADAQEMEWAREVKRRFRHTITREQLAFFRWKTAESEGIDGDLAKALEQYPWLPEHAFQASGSAFLSSTSHGRLRRQVREAPEPQFFRLDWGDTWDDKDDPRVPMPALPRQRRLDEAPDRRPPGATLTIWEEKHEHGVYVVSGDPAYGASETSDSYAVTVWRCFPDQLVQVAEYESTQGTMYQFAWLLAYLSGYYDRYLIYDLNGPGRSVLEELRRMMSRGWGMRHRSGRAQDVLGNIEQFLQARPDAMQPSFNWQYLATGDEQESTMEQLRNEIERGTVVVRSATLMHQLTALIRHKDTTRIEAGGVAHDDLAITAAMAVKYWLGAIQEEIDAFVAPKTSEDQPPPDPGQRLLRNFFARLREPADEEPPHKTYGVRVVGPGR
jgi:hypothetical protein